MVRPYSPCPKRLYLLVVRYLIMAVGMLPVAARELHHALQVAREGISMGGSLPSRSADCTQMLLFANEIEASKQHTQMHCDRKTPLHAHTNNHQHPQWSAKNSKQSTNTYTQANQPQTTPAYGPSCSRSPSLPSFPWPVLWLEKAGSNARAAWA